MNANYSEALEMQVLLRERLMRSDGAELYAKLHYAAQSPADDEALASSFKRDRTKLVEMLKRATPYYWTPDVLDAVNASGQSLPDWTLMSTQFPSRYGFFWFGKPIAVMETPDYYLRGYVWVTGDAGEGRAGAYVFPLMCRPDGASVVTGARTAWHFGRSLTDLLAGTREVMAKMVANKYPGEAWLNELNASALSQLQANMLRLFAASLAFLEQRILVTRSEPVERHARKRLARYGDEEPPLIRVVELRRRELRRGAQNIDLAARHWGCQWLVGGHWRQQFYPSKHANQPIWITPYVKGPEDKPLKAPRTTVFAVVR